MRFLCQPKRSQRSLQRKCLCRCARRRWCQREHLQRSLQCECSWARARRRFWCQRERSCWRRFSLLCERLCRCVRKHLQRRRFSLQHEHLCCNRRFLCQCKCSQRRRLSPQRDRSHRHVEGGSLVCASDSASAREGGGSIFSVSACAGAQEGGTLVSAHTEARAQGSCVSETDRHKGGDSLISVSTPEGGTLVSACADLITQGSSHISKCPYLRAGAHEAGSCVSLSTCNPSACKVQCSLVSASVSASVGEGGSCVSASSCKIEHTLFSVSAQQEGGYCVREGGSTIFGLRDNLANRENEMGLQDAAGVSSPADECTPGFSHQCLISPQECCGVQ